MFLVCKNQWRCSKYISSGCSKWLLRTSVRVLSVWSVLHLIRMQNPHSVKASGEKKQKKAGTARLGEDKNNPASFDQDQAG